MNAWDHLDNWVEGEIFQLKISVGKYTDDSPTPVFGSTNGPNIAGKDVYVELFECSGSSVTPMVQKSRVSGISTTGIAIDEDTLTKSDLLVDFKSTDYPAYPPLKFNTDGKDIRLVELRAKYKSGTSDEKSIFPYRDPITRRMVHFYINLIPKLITA